MKTTVADFITNRMAAPSQAHWPTERAAVILEARASSGGKWPEQLTSGVMFYMGERITRAEFEGCKSRLIAASKKPEEAND